MGGLRRSTPTSRAGALASACGLAGILLAGCASPGPYRTDADDQHRIVERGPDYQVGYVEFDEQGWFWMPQSVPSKAGSQPDIGYRMQMRAVQNMVTAAAHLDTPKAAAGIILVAFVHGWRNNAAPDQPNNVPEFKAMLANLAAGEKAHAQNPRQVVGVYIGWPGLSLDVEPLETGTFYSRKNTADRVGLYGGVTEVLSRLEFLSDSINANLTSGAPASVFIVIGHSFGAQVVSGSLLQVMTQRLSEGKVSKYVKNQQLVATAQATAAETTGPQPPPDGRPVQPFGDLVVLVNPAFEGERYFNLKTLAEEFIYPDNQRPVLAVFCSETDSATHTWFPIGRLFSTVFARYRTDALRDQQHRTNLRTIPWTDDFVTHQLLTTAEYTRAYGAVPPQPGWNHTTRVVPWQLGDCVLRPYSANPDSWTPFYVVKVDQAIMNGHDDIWGNLFSDFLQQFIAQTDKKPAADAPHRVTRAARATTEAGPPPAPLP